MTDVQIDDSVPTTAGSDHLKQSRVARNKGKVVNPKGTGTTKRVSLTQSGAQKRILAQQKRRDAIELRKMGVTYDKIAEAVGYNSKQEARVQVQKGFHEIVQEPASELRVIQVERLNHLLMLQWQKAQSGDAQATTLCINLMARIDALMGTESAKEVSVTTTNSSVITVQSDQDDFIASMKRFLGVQADGTNAPPQQGQVITGSVTNVQPAIAAPVRQYPPGMGPADALPSAPDITTDDMTNEELQVLTEVAEVIQTEVKTTKAKRAFKVEPDDER